MKKSEAARPFRLKYLCQYFTLNAMLSFVEYEPKQ